MDFDTVRLTCSLLTPAPEADNLIEDKSDMTLRLSYRTLREGVICSVLHF